MFILINSCNTYAIEPIKQSLFHELIWFSFLLRILNSPVLFISARFDPMGFFLHFCMQIMFCASVCRKDRCRKE